MCSLIPYLPPYFHLVSCMVLSTFESPAPKKQLVFMESMTVATEDLDMYFWISLRHYSWLAKSILNRS